MSFNQGVYKVLLFLEYPQEVNNFFLEAPGHMIWFVSIIFGFYNLFRGKLKKNEAGMLVALWFLPILIVFAAPYWAKNWITNKWPNPEAPIEMDVGDRS